ncbi:MAG: hypothetical protein EZS28_028841 [Streblomastix strix]|uniref:Uncharacterized protein n=1 Tax=Streblomastix strix TaxID=222440 RepID=A0A5J4UZP5_9EUKA|nr:MAG: hypothetical protein EZS28_028841 [Streblomastix strix]
MNLAKEITYSIFEQKVISIYRVEKYYRNGLGDVLTTLGEFPGDGDGRQSCYDMIESLRIGITILLLVVLFKEKTPCLSYDDITDVSDSFIDSEFLNSITGSRYEEIRPVPKCEYVLCNVCMFYC